MTLLLKSKTATQKEDSHHAWEFTSTFQKLFFLIAYDITLDHRLLMIMIILIDYIR